MLEVLYFSDRDVKRKLFERVDGAQRLLLVTATRHGPQMKPVAEREPFASLERDLGDLLDQVVVADEGTVEGMWRDPVGDLADALYPIDRDRAYAVASGYVLLQRRAVAAVVRKHSSTAEDRWFLQEALARLDRRVSLPNPKERPGQRRQKGRPPAPTPAEEPAPAPAPETELDAWKLLGIARGAALPEARRAFRALVAQYHPDKVAHLAPEFRELAEERTRQIIAAWERIEAQRREP